MTDLSELALISGISALGFLMIYCRKKKIGNEYIFDSAEWLIFAMMPVASSIFLLYDLENKEWFLAVYFIPLMLWFIIWYLHKKENSEKAHDANKKIIIPFMILVSVGILIWLKIRGVF